MYCKKCGKQIPDASKFCRYCGEPIGKEKQEAPVMPVSDSNSNNPARCPNGHYYDSTKNAECPYCKKEYKELNHANVQQSFVPAPAVINSNSEATEILGQGGLNISPVSEKKVVVKKKHPAMEQAEGKDIRTIRVLLVSMFALLDIAVGIYLVLLFI